ncbi:NAD(P)-binding protein [Penicillium crustosum]|uniref:NAD(P)-binding protein n=1 Tax=Penicillium crustosum TaxID=36656 RepID=UPI00239C54B3|nr:NAD(P)-binding protein [Penicillium crustosum]KAJ5418182.1 NAD(P)-binding protein [Penicillium crustosum]
MGVDRLNNHIIFTGDSASLPLNLCTRNYVAAAYASIFGDTLIEKLEKRTLSLSELRPTSHDIQKALTTKFGVPPAQCTVTIEKVSVQVDEMIKKGEPGALAWYTRRNCGNGDQLKFLGTDIWEVEGYIKASVEDLLVEDRLEEYRPVRKELLDVLYVEYASCV